MPSIFINLIDRFYVMKCETYGMYSCEAQLELRVPGIGFTATIYLVLHKVLAKYCRQ